MYFHVTPAQASIDVFLLKSSLKQLYVCEFFHGLLM